jgi:tellurite resistance protein
VCYRAPPVGSLDRTTLTWWLGRFLLGIAVLVLAGTGFVPRVLHLRDPIGVLTLMLGLYGFHLALSSIAPSVRLMSQQSRMRKQWSEAAREAFDRASLPRRLFYLLVAVAEADGPMTVNEREAVRQFLLERVLDPLQSHELAAWEARPLPVDDRVGLAARIAVGLDEAELDTLFCWACLVAFADGRFQPHEHAALQDVARGLGIPAPRARMLFHLARAQYLENQRRGRNGNAGSGAGGGQARGMPRGTPRQEALAVLGLDDAATPEQIRRRHRELVRKFHPDAQPHLGPAAQREATERFTAIQRAYETLTA